ncbi:hypothetical protein TIFTF001_021882 [Ficus carica]|uniref:Uncharacterized protein n=1 Tax=Ficus carica TaxID=3494 RepID=A0AA88DJW1_FICCA|nr:hypothetical protein TIFTF001_021882 [Ficus carica]
MPPVEEIDEFDDDVSHLVRPDIEWTLPTSSSKPPPTPSLPPPPPTPPLPPPPHIRRCRRRFIGVGVSIHLPRKLRRPPSGAPGALLERHGRLGRQAPPVWRQAHFWGARRPSGPHL